MSFKRVIVFLIIIFFSISFFPFNIHSKSNRDIHDLLNNILPPGTRTDTFEWTYDYIFKVNQMKVFDHEDKLDPLYPVNRGDFIRWLIRTKNIDIKKSNHRFDDLNKDCKNYPYIMTALEVNIIEKTSSFDPESFLVRSDASIWLVKAHSDKAQETAKNFKKPLIPAQDGYDAIPDDAIGTLTTCYLPEFQLMEYRYIDLDDYRYVQAEAPILFGESAYSLFMLAFPPVRGGKIVTEMSMEPGNLFFGLDFSASALDISAMLYQNAITSYDPQWKSFPSLIKRVPTFENGLWKVHEDHEGEIDSMEIVFEIHSGLKWSDGRPLTADDFVFSHYLFNHPSFPGYPSDIIFWIDKVEALDDYTVRKVWNKPYLYANSIFPMPRHFFEEKYNYHLQPYKLNDTEYYALPCPENPEGYKSEQYLKDKAFIAQCVNDEEYNTKPLHAGPYIVNEWNKGNNIILEANPYYVYGTPLIPEIEIQLIPNSEQRISKLIEGALDISLSPITINQAYEMELIPDSYIELYYNLSNTWEHIDFNIDDEFLSDDRVRHALIFGLNREKMVYDLFDGRQPIAYSWFSELHPAYDKASITKYAYDPIKANQLLDEAGWKINPDTNYREKNGVPLKITFTTTAGSTHREMQQSYIAEDWRKLNIDVSIVNQFPGEFFNRTLRERKFEGPTATMYAWIMGIHSNLLSILHSDYIPTEENSFRGQNYTAFHNEQVNKLLEENLSSLDKKTIYSNLRKIQKIVTEELPSIPLYHRIEIKAAHRDIANFKSSPMPQANTWNCAYWYWKQEVLPDHPNLIIESDDIDFGNISVYDQPSSSLIVSNYGNQDLKLRIESPHKAVVLSEENIKLAPRMSKNIEVTLDPYKLKEYGPFADLIRIFSNDPYRAECGIIVKAYLMKSPSLEVGNITLKEANIFSLSLKNTGEVDLVGDISSKENFLQFEPSSFSIKSNSSIDILIKLLPEHISRPGPIETNLFIKSNDPIKPEVIIQFNTNFGIRIFLTIGQKKAYINQNEIVLDVAPQIKEGRTLVPLRFIAEAFGADVEWDGELQRITIYFKSN